MDEQIEVNDWMGDTAFSIKASKYDDYKNGVDTILEFIKDDSAKHIALAIDVTISNSLEFKLKGIKKEIKEGRLSKVKYFISEKLGIRGELFTIPRVIVCADINTIKDLQELWLNRENKKLSEHFIQFQILDEIILQLKEYKRYTEAIINENKDKLSNIDSKNIVQINKIINLIKKYDTIFDVYNKYIKLFSDLLKEKINDNNINKNSEKRDGKFNTIVDYINIFEHL